MLRLTFVTGTEPGKWFARYLETTAHGLEEIPADDPLALIESGAADLALIRLPDNRVGEAGQVFHRVTLYEEAPGAAVPKDSVYAEVGEKLHPRELADEHVNFTFAEHALIDDLRSALQVVAANVGVAYAPAPLLKVLAKKQVVVVELTQLPRDMPATEIALVWKVQADSDAIQDFVGVAKGRTRNSSRSAASERPAKSNSKLKDKRGGQRKGSQSNHPKRGVRRKRR